MGTHLNKGNMDVHYRLKRNPSLFRLGVKRPTMNENPAIEKPRVGVRITGGVKLPKDLGFIYGQPNRPLDGGVPDCMRWPQIKQATPKPVCNQRDFIKLNARANVCGMANAKEHAYFRATTDIKRRPSPPVMMLKPTLRLPPDMTFGKPTRVCTPIANIMEHQYQDKWIIKRHHDEKFTREQQRLLKKTEGEPYLTRTTMLRCHQPVVEGCPLWKMPKFSRVKAHLSTFRSKKLRKEAFEHHQADATGRCGIYGHGVIEAAKTM